MVPAIAAWHLDPRPSPANLLSRNAPGHRRSCVCLRAAAAPVARLWPALRRRPALCRICGVPAWRSSLLPPLFGGGSSLEDCSLAPPKRNPGPRHRTGCSTLRADVKGLSEDNMGKQHAIGVAAVLSLLTQQP